MKRLGRVAKARWWVPVLIGLLGLGAGVVLIRARNDSIKPIFEAQALYAVPPSASNGLQQTGSQDSLRSAVERAIEANTELLAESKGLGTVTSDQENFSIVFAARGRDPESATALAEELRTNFVLAEFGAVEINARMELLLVDAIEVKEALDALEPVVPTTAPAIVLDATTQARLDFLLIQVGALTTQSARLVGDLVLAETGEDRNGTVAEIQEQIDLAKEKLAAIYLELETIPTYDPSMLDAARSEGPAQSQGAADGGTTEPRTGQEGAPTATNRDEVAIPEDEDLIGPEWDTAALEDRYAELQADYEALFIDSLNGETGDLDPVRVEETTPSVIPPAVAGGAGFGLGALLAMAGIFLINRIRKPFFVPGDLAPLPVMAEIPVLKGDSGGRLANRRLRRRRGAIQAFRGSMIGVLESRPGPMSIGLTGVKTAPVETRAVMSELAASLGAADRNVLVIDVDFRPVRAATAAVGGATLAGILDLARIDQEGASSQLKQVLMDGPDDHGSTWRLLPAGNLVMDPTDVILSRPFGQLLAEAVTHTDLVLIAVPENGATLADSLYQQLDGVVAVCRSRATRERDLEGLAARLEDRRAELLGGVLLVGKRRRSGGRFSWLNPKRWVANISLPRWRKRRKGNSQIAGASRKFSTDDSYGATGPAGAIKLAKPAELVETAKPAGATKPLVPHRIKSRLAKARVRVRMPTSRWRALPNFLVIGAQRSGTSSLYKYLGQHPSVVPSIRKETEFLTSRHAEGEKWYRAHFPLERDTTDHLDGGRRLTFEADPSYLLDPRAPLRASLLLPDSKVIVLLRDPVARAISHYNHNVRIGLEEASLAEALDLEQDRLQGEVERMAQDPEYPAKQFLRYSYTTRGMYAEQLERWLEFYPSDRVRVVHSEDLFKDTADVYQWLLEFLELEPWHPVAFENFSYTGNGSDNGRVRVVDEAVVARLREQFAPHNERLYDLIDQDFGW